MKAVKPAFGRSPFGPRPYWTEERTRAGLQLYARTHPPQLPRAAEVLDHDREDGVPPARVVWRWFGSMIDAWLALDSPRLPRSRIPLKTHSRWSAEEEGLLLELAGSVTLVAIGRRLHRSYGAVRKRLQELGTTARSNQGYLSASEVARMYGCSYSRVCRLLKSGALLGRSHRHDNRWVVDPVDVAAAEPLLTAPKQTYREENGYATDAADYYARYGIRRIGGERVEAAL